MRIPQKFGVIFHLDLTLLCNIKTKWRIFWTQIYSEKATTFCKISTVDLSYVVTVKYKVEISQNFVAFSEYMNFNSYIILRSGGVKMTWKCFKFNLWMVPDIKLLRPITLSDFMILVSSDYVERAALLEHRITQYVFRLDSKYSANR